MEKRKTPTTQTRTTTSALGTANLPPAVAQLKAARWRDPGMTMTVRNDS
jgi:hypothetical protein